MSNVSCDDDLQDCFSAVGCKMDLSEFFGKGDVNLHLSNIKRYLSASKDSYRPPPIPVEISTFSNLQGENLPFGCNWKQHFHLTDEFTFLNHGALGNSLKESLAVAHAFEKYMDSQPLRAIDRELVPLLAHVLREMADFVRCDPSDLFLTENCTTGISTILRSLPFTKHDSILTLSIGYGAVGFNVDLVCERTGATHHKVQIDVPVLGPDQIVETVKQSLHGGIKLAIFDHIPSNAAFVMPIVELTRICKERDILVLIDGAHSLGQLDLDIASYGADFYITNCHKWFCNTRGSAIGYVKKDVQKDVRPLSLSWGYNRGFSAEFCWAGTQYYSQYISLLSTINFWNAVGAEAIREYGSATVKEAARKCCQAWKVELICPEDMMGMMALVPLPDRLNDSSWSPEGVKKDLVADCLYFEYKIEVPIRLIEGRLYVRLSCHVYNHLSEFDQLITAMLEICDKRDNLKHYNDMFYQIPKSVGW